MSPAASPAELAFAHAAVPSFVMAVERVAAEGGPGGGDASALVTRCVAANVAYLALAGAPADVVVGRTLAEIFPAEQARALQARHAAVVASGEAATYEARVDLPAGALVLETTLAPARDTAGTVTHLVGTVRDRTAEVRVREAAEHAAAVATVASEASEARWRAPVRRAARGVRGGRSARRHVRRVQRRGLRAARLHARGVRPADDRRREPDATARAHPRRPGARRGDGRRAATSSPCTGGATARCATCA
jgi:PAS domain S-box-containing protein